MHRSAFLFRRISLPNDYASYDDDNGRRLVALVHMQQAGRCMMIARTNSSITRFMTPVLGGNSRDGGPTPRTVASKYTNTTVRPVKYSDSNNGRGLVRW